MSNPTTKEKADIKGEFYGICLEVKFALDLFQEMKEDLQEQIKDYTKTINSTKKKLKVLEEKYKLMNGKDIKYTNR